MKVQFTYKESDLKTAVRKSRLRELIINVIMDAAIVILGIVFIILSMNDNNYNTYLGYIFSACGILLFLYYLYKENKLMKDYLSYNNDGDIISYEITGSDISGDIFGPNNTSTTKIYNIYGLNNFDKYIVVACAKNDIIYFPKDQLSNLEQNNIINIINSKKTISKKNK